MITKEILQQFCATDPSRAYLYKPFTIGDYSFAGDGRILVRVPKMDFPPLVETDQTKLAVERITYYFAHDMSDGNYKPMPVEDEKGWGDECGDCEGKKRITHLTCDTCGSTTDLKCEIACPACDGVGKILWQFEVIFNGQRLNAYYLRKLHSLPNVTIANSLDEMGHLSFKFDGGDGRLMPMRAKTTT